MNDDDDVPKVGSPCSMVTQMKRFGQFEPSNLVRPFQDGHTILETGSISRVDMKFHVSSKNLGESGGTIPIGGRPNKSARPGVPNSLVLVLCKQPIRKLDGAGGVVDLPLFSEERNLQDPLSGLITQLFSAKSISSNRAM